MWGAAGMVYEVEEPDLKDPNYDESAQVRTLAQKYYIMLRVENKHFVNTLLK